MQFRTPPEKSQGRFISVEGGEGVGKSSLIGALEAKLRQISQPVLVTREPGGTPMAEALRQIFKGVEGEPILPETESFLISAARAQHVAHKIRPALDQGHWVICDRFADSTRVYQGILAGLDRSWLDSLIHHSTKGLEPDLTLLLDAPVEVALARLAKRQPTPTQAQDAVERFDSSHRDFHDRLRQGYLTLAQEFPNRFQIIDASQTTEQMLAQVWGLLHA